MKIILSKVLKLKLIYPDTNFIDHRGQYIETFNKKTYKKILNLNFVEDDFSLNKQNVFKGIHGDKLTWKLISCLYGKCQVFIINCDTRSSDFGRWEKFLISPKKYFQILIPPKFGNSYLVLSKFAVYHYKQTEYYKGNLSQFTYNINDPYFGIKISKKKLIMSSRDRLAEFVK